MDKREQGACVIVFTEQPRVGRFFYKFGEAGQLMSAWHLGGAETFMQGSARMERVIKTLKKRGVGFEVKAVRLEA